MIDEIEIIMVFPNVIISEDLQLKDLSSAWGRWDVVCRCISATKLLSDQTSVSFIGIFSHQNDWIVLRINPDDWNQWSLSEIDIADHMYFLGNRRDSERQRSNAGHRQIKAERAT